MTFGVIIEADASQDWREAVEGYDGRESGAGARFNAEIYAVIQILADDPERFPLVSKLTRKARILG